MRTVSIHKWISWLLFLLSILFLLSGFGITEPGLVGLLTFGVLGKALSSQIHSLLWGPFLFTLLLHVYVSCFRGKKRKIITGSNK
jgi:hypothetical protein